MGRPRARARAPLGGGRPRRRHARPKRQHGYDVGGAVRPRRRRGRAARNGASPSRATASDGPPSSMPRLPTSPATSSPSFSPPRASPAARVSSSLPACSPARTACSCANTPPTRDDPAPLDRWRASRLASSTRRGDTPRAPRRALETFSRTPRRWSSAASPSPGARSNPSDSTRASATRSRASSGDAAASSPPPPRRRLSRASPREPSATPNPSDPGSNPAPSRCARSFVIPRGRPGGPVEVAVRAAELRSVRDEFAWAASVAAFAASFWIGGGALLSADLVSLAAVPSESMAPGIHRGDVMLVDRRRDVAGPRRDGDVVLFKPPDAMLALAAERGAPLGRGDFFVKRVVAVEGDVVEVRAGALLVNGAREKPYPTGTPVGVWTSTSHSTSASVSVRDADSDAVLVAPPPVDCRACKVGRYDVARATVPRGFVFVLGDNRGGSVDSHAWGIPPEGKRRGARPRARRARRPRGTVERERRGRIARRRSRQRRAREDEVNRRRRFRVCCSYLS